MFAVQNRRVVFARLHRGVILLDCLYQALTVDAQLVRQLLNSPRLGFRDLGNAILITQQVLDLIIENLYSHAERLLQDFPSVLGIGIVAEVGAFIDKTFALGIDDEPKGIGVFLIELGHGTV